MEHRRIYRARDKEGVIQGLMSANHPTFKEIWRVLMFSASVGYRFSRREALGPFDSSRGIDFQTFSNSPAWPGFLYILSLVDKDDSGALVGSQEMSEGRIVLFEEYANGGLSVIQERCESRTYNLDSIIALILEANSEPVESGDLADITI